MAKEIDFFIEIRKGVEEHLKEMGDDISKVYAKKFHSKAFQDIHYEKLPKSVQLILQIMVAQRKNAIGLTERDLACLADNFLEKDFDRLSEGMDCAQFEKTEFLEKMRPLYHEVVENAWFAVAKMGLSYEQISKLVQHGTIIEVASKRIFDDKFLDKERKIKLLSQIIYYRTSDIVDKKARRSRKHKLALENAKRFAISEGEDLETQGGQMFVKNLCKSILRRLNVLKQRGRTSEETLAKIGRRNCEIAKKERLASCPIRIKRGRSI